MVRVSNIILPPEGDFLLLKKKAARILGVPMGKIAVFQCASPLTPERSRMFIM